MIKIYGLTDEEYRTAIQLRSQGWRVFRGGWPDFLCLRETEIGWRALAAEVKKGNDLLKREQKNMLTVLSLLGIETTVIRHRDSEPAIERPRLVQRRRNSDSPWPAATKPQDVFEMPWSRQ